MRLSDLRHVVTEHIGSHVSFNPSAERLKGQPTDSDWFDVRRIGGPIGPEILPRDPAVAPLRVVVSLCVALSTESVNLGRSS